MSETYAVYIAGLSDKDELAQLGADVKIAARRAVNYAVARAKTAANRQMREQINWTASYLDGKLKMRTADGLTTDEARIDVAFTPTSLARFVVGSKRPWKAGVRLHVDTARMTYAGRMFIVPLKRGVGEITEENRNLGLAIRLRPGETIKGKYKTKEIGKGLYLLYGPSSAQVFYTVAEDVMPDAQGWLDQEFQRQMNLGTKA